jgi:hypothetical protein
MQSAAPLVGPLPVPAPVPSPQALTRLLHLASTTLPVGAFSYSQGLEWAVEGGWPYAAAWMLLWTFFLVGVVWPAARL